MSLASVFFFQWFHDYTDLREKYWNSLLLEPEIPYQIHFRSTPLISKNLKVCLIFFLILSVVPCHYQPKNDTNSLLLESEISHQIHLTPLISENLGICFIFIFYFSFGGSRVIINLTVRKTNLNFLLLEPEIPYQKHFS